MKRKDGLRINWKEHFARLDKDNKTKEKPRSFGRRELDDDVIDWSAMIHTIYTPIWNALRTLPSHTTVPVISANPNLM